MISAPTGPTGVRARLWSALTHVSIAARVWMEPEFDAVHDCWDSRAQSSRVPSLQSMKSFVLSKIRLADMIPEERQATAGGPLHAGPHAPSIMTCRSAAAGCCSSV